MPKMPRFRRAQQKNLRVQGAGRVVLASVSLVAMTACASSFFTITPEDGSAPPAAKPAVTKPAVEKPAPKPQEKQPDKPQPKAEPKPERPREETKPAVAKPAEKVATTPPPKADPKAEQKSEPTKVEASKVDPKAEPLVARPPAAPPVARRPEPAIVEPPAVEPSPAGSDSAGIARLMHAAALWDVVRLYHPAAIANPDAWDNATVRRLTDIRSAKAPGEYSQALRRWLDALRDPVSRVSRGDPREDFATGVGGEQQVAVQTQVVVTGTRKTRTADTTLVVTWPSQHTLANAVVWSNLREVLRQHETVSQLVIDLRSREHAIASLDSETPLRAVQRDVASLMTSFRVAGPSIRRRAYAEWGDERRSTSSDSARYWQTGDPMVVVEGKAAPRARRIVFVANASTAMPPALMALVSNGQAVLASEADLSDYSLAPRATFAMGDSLVATIRTGEIINADGSTGINADTVVAPASAASDSAPVLRTAIRIARGQLQLGSTAARNLANATGLARSPNVNDAASWNAAHYPIMGARLLALFKSWATLRTFHAYNELRDENIDDALYRLIPRVESATDAYSYASAMLDFASTTTDAQVRLSSPTLEQHLGAASAPFAVRWVEGRAIITQVAQTDAGRAAGVVVGEEVSSADGYPMPAYVNEHRRYGAASNDWTRLRNTMDLVPRGVPGAALYRIRDANNRERSVNIERTAENARALPLNERASSAISRDLGTGFAYVDAVRATTADIEKAFQDFGSSRALIVDARGTVGDSALTAPLQAALRRLAQQPRVVVAKQSLRLATSPCPPVESQSATSQCIAERRQFDEIIPADTTRRYRGRVVVLVDERTEGATEKFAMALESAANATLVGSATAGAAGTVNAVRLPGVMTLAFSGSEVRRPDGGQLQRVGLNPAVEARPTVKGIRAGTDEVLERAQLWLREQLDPQPARRRR